MLPVQGLVQPLTSQDSPVYITREVWDEVEDMSEVLKKMEERGFEGEEPGPEPA